MSDQPSLPGFDPPSKPAAKSPPKLVKRPRYRLFFGLFPGIDQAPPITALGAQLRLEHALKGKLLDAHRLHITLHDLGGYEELPQEIVAAARSAGDSMAERSFDIMFDHAMSFPGSDAYVLCDGPGIAEVSVFRQNLGAAMLKVGLKAKRDFTPHMTLLYDQRIITKHGVAAVRWTARDLFLINSHVGHSVHEILGRWPLSD